MTKLNSVRRGDRAEYLTQGILSALGFTIQILRQEDYGIDFICTLSERQENVSVPTKSFSIQLKTSTDNIIYDIENPKKVRWLFENNLPFFICYFDNENNSLSFFSTSLLNSFLITRPKKVKKLSFRMLETPRENTLHLRNHNKKRSIFIVDLGVPFLTISINDIISDKLMEERKFTIDKYIDKELENIVYRNLDLPFMRWPHMYGTNRKVVIWGWAHFSDDKVMHSDKLLEKVGHILLSLCHTYMHEKKEEEYQALKKIILKLPFNEEYKNELYTLGFRDAKGNPK
jgi:hypothetical protein